MNLREAFFKHLYEKELIQKTDRVLLALSGGKDSVCLFFLLLEAKERLGTALGACHIHHGIRGEEADRDLAFSRTLAETHGIPFYEVRVDAPRYCEEQKLSLEEGARILRYEALTQIAESYSYDKIATAHSASDQMETVLFRLIRGSGGKGLCGIPEKNGRVIRPLLPFSSEEILEWLEENRLSFIQDSSNLDTLYTRNKIRQNIIPECKAINPRAEKAVTRCAEILSLQEAFLKKACDVVEDRAGLSLRDKRFPLEALIPLGESKADHALLYRCVESMAENENIAIDFCHFEAVLSLLKNPKEGKIIEISQGYVFTVRDHFLCFEKNHSESECIQYKVELSFGENKLPENSGVVILREKRAGKVSNIHKNHLIIHAAFDRIEGSLFARNYLAGDRFVTDGMTHRVKKLFQKERIPLGLRKNLPLICDEKGIFWIPFIGLCDRARDPRSDQVFTMSLQGELWDNLRKAKERENG